MAGAVLSGLGLVADVAGVIFVAVAQHRLLAVLGNWLDRKSPTSNVSNSHHPTRRSSRPGVARAA
jgi:hypothetical protein